jgi:hypothetical protein
LLKFFNEEAQLVENVNHDKHVGCRDGEIGRQASVTSIRKVAKIASDKQFDVTSLRAI